MKKIFIALTLLINIFCYSQAKYKKVEKGMCKIDHTCRLETYYDQFEETLNYRIGFYETNLVKSKYGETVSYTLNKRIDKNKKKAIVLTIFGNAKGCRNKDSYVHFLFKNGEKLKLNSFFDSIDCGTSFIGIILNVEDLNFLLNNEIDKIRLQYMDASEDIVVSEKGQNKLFGNLKCIVAVE